jgi:hypothetical protein
LLVDGLLQLRLRGRERREVADAAGGGFVLDEGVGEALAYLGCLGDFGLVWRAVWISIDVLVGVEETGYTDWRAERSFWNLGSRRRIPHSNCTRFSYDR